MLRWVLLLLALVAHVEGFKQYHYKHHSHLQRMSRARRNQLIQELENDMLYRDEEEAEAGSAPGVMARGYDVSTGSSAAASDAKGQLVRMDASAQLLPPSPEGVRWSRRESRTWTSEEMTELLRQGQERLASAGKACTAAKPTVLSKIQAFFQSHEATIQKLTTATTAAKLGAGIGCLIASAVTSGAAAVPCLIIGMTLAAGNIMLKLSIADDRGEVVKIIGSAAVSGTINLATFGTTGAISDGIATINSAAGIVLDADDTFAGSPGLEGLHGINFFDSDHWTKVAVDMGGQWSVLSDWHQQSLNLDKMKQLQQLKIQEESLSAEIAGGMNKV